jgi:hypothetical protein
MSRVVVVHTGSIFGESLERLLAGVVDIEVMAYDPRFQGDLFRALARIEPDVVIMTGGRMDLPVVPRLLRSLANLSRFRVLIVGDDDNLVHIYNIQQMAVSSTADLITLIRGDSGLV